ncbi:hypothetical protein [Caulobacter sp. UNC279MFTsu5.1]|nr:hypothetical protein [Caulobacter sp. UNC279MFTsu5.1]
MRVNHDPGDLVLIEAKSYGLDIAYPGERMRAVHALSPSPYPPVFGAGI